MIFAYPWLLALLPLPLLVRYFSPSHQEQRASIRVPMFDVLVEASGQTPASGAVIRRRSWMQAISYMVIWTLLVVAVARPQFLEPPITKQVPTRDLMLAIDLSGSMETQDFKNAAGEKVNRLAAVKEVLDEFLTRRDGDRVGMIVFGTGAFVQIPFTQDLDVCRQLLQETRVRMAGPQTSFGDAIGLAITVFERSELQDKVLIALTDGNDTGSRVPPSEAAKIAADQGIVIHTIGVGDPQAAGEELLDEEALQDVAKETGGEYFFAADRNQLDSIYKRLDEMSQRKVDNLSYRPKRDLFQWFVAIAMLTAMGYFACSLVLMGFRSRLVSNANRRSESVVEGDAG
ncbi:Ca-activated chloride channel family protein [Neorhodopirellula lusitana]|uniref:Ca-activated chloride channel family protein n=1 Tax=Neorhodopirellula lusitana TaxID=445327 RepID=A0ABY1PT97_9BACT|nr:VWA domain-containing protein [Neorhodopirellula lusitana]SMP42566.1 Ca-activated chloride channel family protein [Neorhodopirellula lusitana]